MAKGFLMRLGYNTNGLSDHDLGSAIEIIAGLGYQAIAITLDHDSLNPYGKHLTTELATVSKLVQKYKLDVVIETGARFLLDKWKKHQPTLISSDAKRREQRIDFLCRSIDIAAQFGAKCVSFWSGAADDCADSDTLTHRLSSSLDLVLEKAQTCQIPLGFEPEPGMFIDTLESFDTLLCSMERLGVDSTNLHLTIDIGHLHCQGETPIAKHLRHWKSLRRMRIFSVGIIYAP